MNDLKKIRIGIIGAGKIVEVAHLPQLAIRNDVEIAWIFDRDGARAQRLAQSYRSKAVLQPDYSGVELALLALPLGAREPFIAAAAAAGIALYVEKPAARNRDEHQRLVERFAPHACAIGLQRRFYPQVALLRLAIERRWFGSLQSVQLHSCNFNLKSGGSTHFTQDVSQAGGGITIESAIHLIDIVVWICAATNARVLERRAFAQGLLDFEMRFQAELIAEFGASVPFNAQISTLRNDPRNGFELHFERALLRWSGDPAAPVRLIDGESEVAFGAQYSSVAASFIHCWDSVFKALREAKANASSARNSSATSALMGQLYQDLAQPEKDRS